LDISNGDTKCKTDINQKNRIALQVILPVVMRTGFKKQIYATVSKQYKCAATHV
jgi:hypothetical protein